MAMPLDDFGKGNDSRTAQDPVKTWGWQVSYVHRMRENVKKKLTAVQVLFIKVCAKNDILIGNRSK